mmetsp:Transcript_33504/g.49062  ORF Transcript_33504/g.49062 Transcript_33504/m.49062 type:complete len:209 (+) Transcript_33504:123-749(+)
MSHIYYHQKQCLTAPIIPSAIFGCVFAGIDSMSGMNRLTPQVVGSYMAGIYAYNAVQCPMEAIHGKQSSIHNLIAGGSLGYIGIRAGRLGVPFVDPYAFFEIWTFTCSSGGRCVWWYGIFIGDAWWKTNLRTKRLEQKGWNKNDVIDINIHVTAHGKRLEIKQERDGVVVTIMGEGKCIRQEEILFGFSVSTHRFWFKIPLLIIPDET